MAYDLLATRDALRRCGSTELERPHHPLTQRPSADRVHPRWADHSHPAMRRGVVPRAMWWGAGDSVGQPTGSLRRPFVRGAREGWPPMGEKGDDPARPKWGFWTPSASRLDKVDPSFRPSAPLVPP